MLLEECAKGSVEIACSMPIADVSHADSLFRVQAGARTVSASSMVIATGGPAIPKMGATGFAYDLARRFGLKVVQPRPALVPLTLSGEDALFQSLSGVSADVVARCGKAAFREAALFTHRGLSGPAILQVSSYWRHGDQIGIDFLPGRPGDWLLAAKRASPRTSLRRLLRDALSERLADTLCAQIGVEGEFGTLPDRALAAAQARLADWRFTPNGSEGYAKAEVTAGGISTADLSSGPWRRAASPGLYAIGEAVDVTGWLGGYNFQWAWASASAAGQVA